MHHDKNSPFVMRRQCFSRPTALTYIWFAPRPKLLEDRPLRYYEFRNRAGQIVRAEVSQ